MRILFITNNQYDMRSGACRSTVFRQQALCALGHEVDIIWMTDVKSYVPIRKGSKNLNFAVAVVPEIQRLQALHGGYDIVQIWSGDAYLYGVWRKLARFQDCRPFLINDTYGIEHPEWEAKLEEERRGNMQIPFRAKITYPLLRLNQVKWSIKLSDWIICHNQGDKEFIIGKKWANRSRISVIPHGISPAFSDAGPATEHGKGLLYVGTWIHRKGIAYLIEAFEKAVEQCPGLWLSIVGTKIPAEQVLGCFPPEVRSRVRVVPSLSEQALQKEYLAHDIFVFPTLYEGFGTVFLEAMACGLPVVGTRVGGLPDIVEDEISGILVAPRDSDSLARAITRLWTNETQRQRMGRAARAKASGYSWANIAEIYEKLYHDLLQQSR